MKSCKPVFTRDITGTYYVLCQKFKGNALSKFTLVNSFICSPRGISQETISTPSKQFPDTVQRTISSSQMKRCTPWVAANIVCH